ncbi:MAG: hypothetical protein CMN30_25330 [Sandaracinus sp.]|nr:hypothetical protein [Sandaracinus sp.]
MRAHLRSLVTLAPLALAALGAMACEETPPPASSYYDERISPILEVGCAQQTNGCHIDLDGSATGNLDLSSFDALMQREDVLAPYGPYPVGLLLLKGSDDVEIPVETWDADPTSGERVARITTDIRHNAGSLLDVGSTGYAELKRWIASGAERTGVQDETLSANRGECVSGVPEFHGFDAAVAPEDTVSFDRFRNEVQPVMRETCAGSQCHGQRLADLYLTCGDTEEELRWNYFVAMAHVTTPVSTSGILRRPLSTYRGGSFHEGGHVFASPEDDRYEAIAAWAEDLATRRPDLLVDPDPDPGLRFFANRVQPAMVREGCMFLGCHSPTMFHDLRLRGGDQGVFSRIATFKNYEMSRELLAIESPDPNAGRLVAKNLFPATQIDGAQGIVHRGGSLFEDFSGGGAINPATADDCASYDAEGGDLNEVPAYCVIARWHEIEREQAAARGEIEPLDAPVDGVVWVARPVGVGDPLDFDTFRGGADLRFASASLDAGGAIALDASGSLLGGCAGLGGDVDVRTPAVSWDGSRIAFAARTAASEPLRLYWMNADGSGCEPVPGTETPPSENGILVHDFDPAWAPDDRLVFASTRGNVDGAVDYRGPTRTPAAMQPNANLFVLEPGGVRQMTFLLNQELAPNFMRDGRLIFTTQKRQPGFHQLALRRQNLDGGDYHPLFGQRESVGFDRSMEVVELVGGNDYAFVAGPLNAADGAGTIVVANRSIGPDQAGRDPGDRDYLHSMRIPVPGAFGAIPGVPSGPGGQGAFRSPAALPTGRILVSCDLGATDLTAGPFGYQLCEMDPIGESVRAVGGEAGMANVEAVAVYGRARHPIFHSRMDEANGATRIDASFAPAAELHVLDFPLLETLLFANIRTPRDIDPEVGGFTLYEVRPPPQAAGSFADVMGDVVTDEYGMVYVDDVEIGWVPLEGDGSARFYAPGGRPFRIGVTDDGGDLLAFGADAPFMGDRVQREQMQLYPGERLRQSFPRRFFNGLCGTCHGSITGRELDVAVDPDILTRASQTYAAELAPLDLR